MTETSVPAVRFSTVLAPHRSLSPRGFRWVIGAAIAGNLAIGLPMMLFGAWPVLGFMGLDVYLLWWLFNRSYFDARRREALTLTDHDLVVERVAPDGERERHRLDAYWLRVELAPEAERLVVISRGSRLVIGRFLAPSERQRVAEELKAVIATMRSPRYDHSWD